MNEPLWRNSAVDLAKAIANREVSSTDVVESTLDRIAKVNPEVNAIVDTYADEARSAASATDAYLASGFSLGPLGGVPVAIKDNTHSIGHPATNGIPAHANELSAADDPVVENLRHAGGVIVGRTNLPPWCWQWFATNELFGSTTNPRNAELTPGGSSGGAGAAVAAGFVPVAQGNDIAGSIRYPAYANGIVGLRPTVGAVPGNDPSPEDKPIANQLFAVQGPLARTVGDVELAFHAMKGYSPRDAVTVPPVSLPIGPRRVGVYRGEEIAALSPHVAEALSAAAAALANAGYEVEDLKTDLFLGMFELEELLVIQEFIQSDSPHLAEGGAILENGLAGHRAVVEQMFGSGYTLTLHRYTEALARRGTIIRKFQALLERYPVILTPAATEAPFLQDEDQSAPLSRRRDMVMAAWPMCTIPATGFPGLVVPTSVVEKDIPLGVQLVGRRFGEQDLFEAGAALERTFGVIPPADF